jgi:Na+/H+ antiporter NhaA
VSDLTFTGLHLDEAKMGVLGASVLAAIVGTVILLVTLPKKESV